MIGTYFVYSRFGRLGAPNQFAKKTFNNPQEAVKEFEEILDEKITKGFQVIEMFYDEEEEITGIKRFYLKNVLRGKI